MAYASTWLSMICVCLVFISPFVALYGNPMLGAKLFFGSLAGLLVSILFRQTESAQGVWG